MEKLLALPPGVQGARLYMDMRFMEEPKDTVFFYAETDGKMTPVRSAEITFRLKHFTGNRPGLFLMAEKTPGGTAVFADFVFHGIPINQS